MVEVTLLDMNKIISFIAILGLAAGLGLSASKFEQTQAQVSVDSTRNECPPEITNQISELKAEFYISLEAQLESPELNSERLHDVYQDYYNVQTNINEYANSAIVDIDGLEDSTIAQQNCRNIIDAELNEISTVFAQYVGEIGTRKRNFILLEKYDGINDQLKEVQEQLHDVRQNINQFHDQLPCIVDQCIQS